MKEKNHILNRNCALIRIFLDLFYSLIVIGIGIFCFDLYFYVWIFAFLNIVCATTISLGIFFLTVPLLREKESKRKYSRFDRICIYVTLSIGTLIILLQIIGVISIPEDFHPIFRYTSERFIHLIMYTIYCFVAEYLIRTYSKNISNHLNDLKIRTEHKQPSISFLMKSNKRIFLLEISEKITMIMSCYFEALYISSIVFIICSLILSPYTNPNMPLPFVK